MQVSFPGCMYRFPVQAPTGETPTHHTASHHTAPNYCSPPRSRSRSTHSAHTTSTVGRPGRWLRRGRRAWRGRAEGGRGRWGRGRQGSIPGWGGQGALRRKGWRCLDRGVVFGGQDGGSEKGTMCEDGETRYAPAVHRPSNLPDRDYPVDAIPPSAPQLVCERRFWRIRVRRWGRGGRGRR